MAKSTPCCSSPSYFGLSRSNLCPVTPKRLVSTRSNRVELSPDAKSPRLPQSTHFSRLPCFRWHASSFPAMEPDDSLSATVFVKGLPRLTREGELKKAFSEFGDVTRVQIILDKESMQSRGSAFVWFTSNESAELAMKEMDGEVYLRHHSEAPTE